MSVQPPPGMVECPKCDPCNPDIDSDGRPYTCFCCGDSGWVPEEPEEPKAQGPWIICPTCSGDGKTSRHLGVIDRDEWDPDEFEFYLEGGYDQTCATCGGSGKVRDNPETWRKHDAQLKLERGVNDAGERLW